MNRKSPIARAAARLRAAGVPRLPATPDAVSSCPVEIPLTVPTLLEHSHRSVNFMSANESLGTIWAGVDRLVERADEPALVLHRLEPLAAARLRRLGEEVPPELLEVERLGAAFALAATAHLTRARAAVDEPLLLIKGPELAALYPEPS